MGTDLLSQVELLTYLQISRTTLYKLIKKDDIPHMKLGRKLLFRKKDIDAWLESKRVK